MFSMLFIAFIRVCVASNCFFAMLSAVLPFVHSSTVVNVSCAVVASLPIALPRCYVLFDAVSYALDSRDG